MLLPSLTNILFESLKSVNVSFLISFAEILVLLPDVSTILTAFVILCSFKRFLLKMFTSTRILDLMVSPLTLIISAEISLVCEIQTEPVIKRKKICIKSVYLWLQIKIIYRFIISITTYIT